MAYLSEGVVTGHRHGDEAHAQYNGNVTDRLRHCLVFGNTLAKPRHRTEAGPSGQVEPDCPAQVYTVIVGVWAYLTWGVLGTSESGESVWMRSVVIIAKLSQAISSQDR